MKYAVLLILLCSYGSFLWSVIGVFRKGEPQKVFSYRLLQLTSVTTWLVSLVAVYHAQSLKYPVFGVVTLGLFLVLFWWAYSTIKQRKLTLAFSEDEPSFVYQDGPYKYVRHPFYTAYLGTYFTAAVITSSPWVAICAGLMTAVYLHAALFEEKKFSVSKVSEQYRAYRIQTGRFLPKWSVKS